MIITHEMFVSFDGTCEYYGEGVAIAPLPDEYQNVYDKLVAANRQDIADQLTMRKPQLIQASGDYTLGGYRAYDALEGMYQTAPTFELMEDAIDQMREEFYQANKRERLSAVWIEELPNGAEIWHEEDFENLVPGKKHRIFNSETGENVLCEDCPIAEAFIATRIEFIKSCMAEPKIQQLITYNGGGLSGWLNL